MKNPTCFVKNVEESCYCRKRTISFDIWFYAIFEAGTWQQNVPEAQCLMIFFRSLWHCSVEIGSVWFGSMRSAVCVCGTIDIKVKHDQIICSVGVLFEIVSFGFWWQRGMSCGSNKECFRTFCYTPIQPNEPQIIEIPSYFDKGQIFLCFITSASHFYLLNREVNGNVALIFGLVCFG